MPLEKLLDEFSSHYGEKDMATRPGATFSTPNPNASSPKPQQHELDPYRPIASQVRKPLLSFLPSSSQNPDLPTLLGLDDQTYSSRLSGKNVFLTSGPSTSSSSLVKGRKGYRGDDVARTKAGRYAEEHQREREELGLVGMRKVKWRLDQSARGCIERGMRISYTSLLPLHYLHTSYLLQLLSLPPLPARLPSPLPSLPIGTSPESVQSKLVKAEFTGIILSINSSRNPSRVGIRGIVIEETASTFRIVTSEDMVKVVPKDGTMFGISFPAYSIPPAPGRDDGEVLEPPDVAGHIARTPRMEVSLLGSAFGFRSGERAGRKFRPAQGGGGGSGWGEEWVDGEWAGVLLRELEKGVPKGKSGPPVRGKRKRSKSRRKDPPAAGTLQLG